MEKYYPYIRQLIHKLRLERILDQDKGTKEAVEILYRCQDKKKIWEEIWCQRIMLILAAVILSIIFFLICMAADEPEQVIQDGRIIKNNVDVVTFGVRGYDRERAYRGAKERRRAGPASRGDAGTTDRSAYGGDPREGTRGSGTTKGFGTDHPAGNGVWE